MERVIVLVIETGKEMTVSAHHDWLSAYDALFAYVRDCTGEPCESLEQANQYFDGAWRAEWYSMEDCQVT